MDPDPPPGMERLTDGSTYYWSRIFPPLWSALVGGVAALAWLDVLGDAPAPLAVKVGITAVWAGMSMGFFRWLGRLQDVWLDGDTLVVGDPRRGTRIALRDVREVRESRFVQIKTVRLELARSTPWGSSVDFVPKGIRTFFFPYARSPVAAELRARKEALLAAPGGAAGRFAGS